jgi:predicted nucleic acid-binding Zn finger protein
MRLAMKLPLFPLKKGMIMNSLQEILASIRKSGSISLNQFEKLDRLFGDRFWKGLKLAIENNVKKYKFIPSNKEVWIISSESRDYYTLDDYFCNCKDFFIKVVSSREILYCKHLIAKLLSIALDKYETIEVADNRYSGLIAEWREIL